MGAGTSALAQIESRGGGGPPSGVGGLEHGPDPSPAASRVRAWGVRALGAVAAVALVLLVRARATGNVRDRKFTVKQLAGAPQEAQAQAQAGTDSAAPPPTAPPPPPPPPPLA